MSRVFSGRSHTSPYYVWQAIKKRCHCPQQRNIAWLLGVHEDTVQRALKSPDRKRIRK